MNIRSFLTFLLLCFQGTAQDNLIEKLHLLQQNPALKEKVFIHTNKTAYFPDDTIWFKAYIGDMINHPSIRTTKLYANLIDDRGVIIHKKMILIEEGVGFGQFELKAGIAPGTYYIQAYTNYMRNFGDDYHYLLEIEVLGKTLKQQDSIIKNIYDVQLLPEGGYLLEGVKNTLGIKALVNGKGIDFSGDILNNKGESISSFDSEHIGMAKCELLYKTGEIYTANIAIHDTILKINVPIAQKKGIVLHVDTNTDKDFVNITLKTNEVTFYEEDYSNYSILCHQDHQILDLFSLTRFNSLTGTIRMKKNSFFNGVNSVTLFKKQNPIAERKFFIEKSKKQTVVEIEKIGWENDSINYKLKTRNQKNHIGAYLSVSVLPAYSNTLNEKQNILSAFLLTPFLTGHIENPAYYFNSKNKKRKGHLDLLLLTQGWTQYSFQKMIKSLDPSPEFEFEYGFELKGNVTSSLEYDTIALLRNDYQIIRKESLNHDSNFRFRNLILYTGDTTKVSFIDEQGKIIKPQKINYFNSDGQKNPVAKIPFKNKHFILNSGSQQIVNAQKKYAFDMKSDTITTNSTIVLDEAIVIKKKRSQRYLDRRRIIEKYKPIVSDIGRYYNIPIPEIFLKYDYGILPYLNAQGIRLINDNPSDIHLLDPASREVFVQIDGRLILAEALPGIPLSMQEIENIMVSNEGVINGKLVRGQIYQVFTKKKYGNKAIELFSEHIVKNGYDHSKKYYAPLYNPNPERPTQFIDIDWKPHLRTNSKGETFFKITKNHRVKELLFSVQGFSSEGHLISNTIIKD
ncbi:hypothetical protein [Maribacter sp. 2304DJ31-5]|uniref:hypothetical protein n=1 Tax=Maribacter sp. 2304DJ31-5 TaxID=3386273 RepID=UPI0039BD7206